jgi:sulfoxide reductase heme-binding subunit YedZ
VTASIVTDKALWYLARGTGIVSLVLLTASLVLGITTRHRAGSARVPRFATALLHRNISLLVVAFLAVHIATSVLDPFAGIAWTDAVIPLSGAYRPLWLGLGALAFDMLIAVSVTSILRVRLGLRTWRAAHWLAYVCWPVALVHGLGTGSDVRTSWLHWLVAACVTTVAAAACWRLAGSTGLAVRWRFTAACGVLLAPVLLTLWLESGPLRRGWAAQAGTPAPLLQRAPAR